MDKKFKNRTNYKDSLVKKFERDVAEMCVGWTWNGIRKKISFSWQVFICLIIKLEFIVNELVIWNIYKQSFCDGIIICTDVK